MKHCELDLDNKDRWGRTILEVASKDCLVLLQSIGEFPAPTALLGMRRA